jgi:hypothetical protein
MDTSAAPTLDVDLHRLELRFADTRLLEPRAVEALARSIERSGQLMACIVVPEAGGERLVLVDGYRRILALRRLGRDTAQVQSWACDLAQALLRLLAQSSAPTPRMRPSGSKRWRQRPCPVGNCRAGSSITSAARVRHASAWFPIRVCSCRACKPRRNSAPMRACATDPKGNWPAMFARCWR